jgi:hypothetical protein
MKKILALCVCLAITPAMATDYSGRNEMPKALRGHWCFTKGDHGSEVYRKQPPRCPKAEKTLHVYKDGYFSLVDTEIARPCNAIRIERDKVGG